MSIGYKNELLDVLEKLSLMCWRSCCWSWVCWRLQVMDVLEEWFCRKAAFSSLLLRCLLFICACSFSLIVNTQFHLMQCFSVSAASLLSSSCRRAILDHTFSAESLANACKRRRNKITSCFF